MRKWVIGFLVVALLIVGCGKEEPAPEAPTTPEPVVAPPAPAAPTTGRVVFTVTDKAVPQSQITGLEVELGNVEVHLVNGSESDWTIVSSGLKTFELTTLEGVQALLVDAELAPGKYTQIRLRIADAEAMILGKEYDVEVPGGNIMLVGTLDVVAGETSTATLDFDLNKSLILAGGTAYLKPTIKLITRKDAEVSHNNKTVTIKGGDVVTDSEHPADKLYTFDQLNATWKECREDCDESCGTTLTTCNSACGGKVATGCESESEDYCRETCEPYVHPGYCKKGCQMLDDTDINDTVEECTEYLQDYCAESCNMTQTDCHSDCARDCA